MAKNNKNTSVSVEDEAAVETVAAETAETVDTAAATDSKSELQKVEKKNVVKTKKPVQKKKSDKPNIFKRLGKAFKEMWSELKKVTWAKGSDTWKSTGVVLVVVLAFLVVIGGVDAFLSWLLGILVG